MAVLSIPRRCAVVGLALLGLAATGAVAQDADAPDAAALKEKKMGAVSKAIRMLEDLQSRVQEEGEKEAKAYDKFACFCKDTTTEKTEAIQTGEDEKTSISADINDMASKRDGFDTTISEEEEKIGALEKEMKEAKEKRLEERKVYETNSADMVGALDALDNAIKALKASKNPSFAQVYSIVDTVRAAVAMADAMGVKSAEHASAMFLQEGEVPSETYSFHSDDVISTLEGLQADFRKERDDLDKAETEAQKLHDELMQEKATAKETSEKNLEKSQKDHADIVADIETASQNLATISAVLLEDKAYANKLSKMCADKATTWDQRSELRQNELSTLTQAIAIVKGTVSEKTSSATIRFAQQAASVRMARALAKDGDAMAAIEAEAEAADGVSFVQLRSVPVPRKVGFLAAAKRHAGDGGRQEVAELLKSKGVELKSTLLTSLATQVAGDKDPLAKVKILIQELIERLLKQAENEANQKGWCDKATAEATQKRNTAAEEIKAVNSKMAKLESRRDKLSDDLKTLAKDIKELEDSQAKAEEDRAEEKEEHEAVIEEAGEGLKALNLCIDMLEKFYKTSAKAKVELVQKHSGPEEDAPDAGFEAGEAYKGAQGESGGVIGMLEVMRSDFERTVKETQIAEEEAAQDHNEFMTETGKSLAEKRVAEKENKKYLDETEAKFDEAEAKLEAEAEKVSNAIKELLELKPACEANAMTWEERVAARKDELEALKKAHCILEAYAEYGAEGASGAEC